MEANDIYTADRIMSDLVKGKTLKAENGTLFKIDTSKKRVCWAINNKDTWKTVAGDGWASLFEDEIFYDSEQS